ncbi:hypothetical protein E9228_003289 [Curtobacterium flaccumfaciens]|uniref:Uncharacterized protein n=1 Tax=Curtobacterium salicis TaxID=1779862 RepID=A0ABX0TAV7_9MICO|nr:hypothetical protein [Curtobacterium sp. WW7]NII42615.1 hypothetical protein [Curtobacterium sp. WW7]
MRDDEYDAFGPWIDEVDSVALTPRLYRDHPIDFDTALLVLKVPRDIERRNANPSMHLYDALIIVMPNTITVLVRSGDTYTTRVAQLDDVFAVEDSVHLLDGRLTIHFTNRAPIAVHYNGSARGSIGRLVDLLRASKVTPVAKAGKLGQGAGAIGTGQASMASILVSDRDHGLRGDCVDVFRTEPQTVFLGGHTASVVRPAGGLVTTLAHRIRPAYLQGAAVIAAPGEVSVIHRRAPITRGRGDDLSHARTFVFPDRVQTVVAKSHPLYQDVDLIRFGSPSPSVELVVPAGSATATKLLADAQARQVQPVR